MEQPTDRDPLLDRPLLQLLGRYSNIGGASLDRLFAERVYADAGEWTRFLRLLLLAGGSILSCLGIIFFFAYNWDALPGMVKLGLVEGLLLLLSLLAVWPRMEKLRPWLLLSASILVGALFALFGQIYQTGANAYDFFLAWAVFSLLWVWVASLPLLWLLWVCLLNVTLGLYAQQVGGWHWTTLISLLLAGNLLPLSLFLHKGADWCAKLLYAGLLVLATSGMVVLLFLPFGQEGTLPSSIALWVLGLGLYAAGIVYGYHRRQLFYPAAAALAAIVLGSSLLVKVAVDWLGASAGNSLLPISLLVVGMTTLAIRQLINLQKKWNHEEEKDISQG